MNDATKVYINKVADSVRSTFDVGVPIDNIDCLVNQLGGSIVEKPGLDPLYDGTIKKVGDSSFEIAIFPRQSRETRNFTIAYELGHLFLHMGYLISEETWHQYGKSGQCGQFAHFGTDVSLSKHCFRRIKTEKVLKKEKTSESFMFPMCIPKYLLCNLSSSLLIKGIHL